MTHYKMDKHGIVIGWDNIWSNRDESGIMNVYKSILWCEPYNITMNNYNALNLKLLTPAQQIVMDRKKEGYLDHYIVDWLNKNTYGWSVDLNNKMVYFFFKKVTHARSFRAWINTHLEGIKIGR